MNYNKIIIDGVVQFTVQNRDLKRIVKYLRRMCVSSNLFNSPNAHEIVYRVFVKSEEEITHG